MNDKVRAIMAVIVGITAGVVVIFFIEYLASRLNPMPADLDPNNLEALNTHMRSASSSMWLMILLAYILGSFVAGWVTNLVAKGTRYQPAVIAGVGLMITGILNMFSFYHPVWFWVVSIPSYLLCAWLGGRLVHNVPE